MEAGTEADVDVETGDMVEPGLEAEGVAGGDMADGEALEFEGPVGDRSSSTRLLARLERLPPLLLFCCWLLTRASGRFCGRWGEGRASFMLSCE